MNNDNVKTITLSLTANELASVYGAVMSTLDSIKDVPEEYLERAAAEAVILLGIVDKTIEARSQHPELFPND